MNKISILFIAKTLLLAFIFFPIVIAALSSITPNRLVAAGFYTVGSKVEISNYLSEHWAKILISLLYTTAISFVASYIMVKFSFVLAFLSTRYLLLKENLLFFLVSIVYCFPAVIYAIGVMPLLGSVNLKITTWWNSLLLMLTFVAYLLPFCYWTLYGFFKYVPFSLDRQAVIDNVPTWKLLRVLMGKYLQPVTRILMLITFLICFNDIVFSHYLTDTEEYRLIGHFLETVYISEAENKYAEICAAGISISAILVLLSYYILRNYYKFLIKENSNRL